jgi:hypothetical protein
MKQNPLKDTFNVLKRLGYYKDYENYEAYRKFKFGEDTPELTDEEKEERFVESLPEGEQQQFKEMFGG